MTTITNNENNYIKTQKIKKKKNKKGHT